MLGLMLVQCITSLPVEETGVADLNPAESGAIIIGGFGGGRRDYRGYGHHGHSSHHRGGGGFIVIGASNRG